MSIESKIFAALSPLVGLDADGAKCCYPDVLKQGVTAVPGFQAIVFQVISSNPGPVSQVANINYFRVQLTLHCADFDDLVALRTAVLAAVRAMGQFITYQEIGGGFEAEPKAFSRILDVQFRDTET